MHTVHQNVSHRFRLSKPPRFTKNALAKAVKKTVKIHPSYLLGLLAITGVLSPLQHAHAVNYYACAAGMPSGGSLLGTFGLNGGGANPDTLNINCANFSPPSIPSNVAVAITAAGGISAGRFISTGTINIDGAGSITGGGGPQTETNLLAYHQIGSNNATGVINANTRNAISGGNFRFTQSVLNVTAGEAISGGNYRLHSNSTLNVNARNGISGGTFRITDSGGIGTTSTASRVMINAASNDPNSTSGSISGGTLTFEGTSKLIINTTNALNGSSRLIFMEDSQLDVTANITNPDRDGEPGVIGAGSTTSFIDSSVLNANSARSIYEGVQQFSNRSQLNANATKAISGGKQSFGSNASLNANVSNAVTGGSQQFIDTTLLRANASNALSGGIQMFSGFSELTAAVTDAVSGSTNFLGFYEGGRQSFSGGASLQVRAPNGVNHSKLELSGASHVELNGFSISLAGLQGSGGGIYNNSSTPSTITLNNSESSLVTFAGQLGGLSAIGTSAGLVNLHKKGTNRLDLTNQQTSLHNVSIEKGSVTFRHVPNSASDTTTTSVSGDFSVSNGARVGVVDNAFLTIAGQLNLAAGSTLDLTLASFAGSSTQADITAASANIDGANLKITGFASGGTPGLASDFIGDSDDDLVLSTTNGITGNFASMEYDPNVTLSYLRQFGHFSADRKDYFMSFDLAWTDGGKEFSTGDFNIEANSTFEVDIPLAAQTKPSGGFNSNWDGNSLVKNGLGTLILSKANTYTGSTTINSGTLTLTKEGSISNSSDVTLTSAGSTLDIRAANGTGLIVNNLTGATDSQLLWGDADLTLHNDYDTHFQGNFDVSGQIIITGKGVITLSGRLLYTGNTYLNDGGLTLDGSAGNGKLVSNIIGQSGSSLVLTNGASLTGTIDPTNVFIDQTSSWLITGNSVVDQLVLRGNIYFTPRLFPMTTAYTLTLKELLGRGGHIFMNTLLTDSNSLSDRIIIDGGVASGTTYLQINSGGDTLGDLTLGDGINIVHTINGGSTEENAFILNNPNSMVSAGAYNYTLSRGGVNAESDWFLSSSVRDGQNNRVANYSPATSLYSAKASQLLRYDEVMVSSLAERVGDLEMLRADNNLVAWGRFIRRHDNNQGSSNGIYSNSVAASGDLSAVQVGSDVYVNKQENSRTSVGAFISIGKSKFDVTHVSALGARQNAGANDFTAFSLAAYLTRLNDDGSYFDVVLQGSTFSTDSLPQQTAGSSSKALDFISSVEVGQRFTLGETASGYSVEPYAQLLLQNLSIDNAQVDSRQVKFDNANDLLLRTGARFSKTWSTKARPAVVWLTPSLTAHAGKATSAWMSTPTQGGVELKNNLLGTSASLQIGASGQINERISMNTHFDAEHSLGGDKHTSYSGQIGLSVEF